MKRVLFMVSVLPLLALADDQQPFTPISLGAHVGYLNGHVAPEADLMLKVRNPVAGFQPFSLTGFSILAVKDNPVQLQASAVTGIVALRQIGEYVDVGPVTQFGVGNDGKNTAMIGKAGLMADYRFGHSQRLAAELILTATRSPLGNYMPEGLLGVRYWLDVPGLFPGARAPKVKKLKAPKTPKA